MLDLSLRIRSVAFLLLSSTCLTYLVQSMCNRSSDLVDLYHPEELNNLASVALYIDTNNTSNVLTYNPNMIHSQMPYKQLYKWKANVTTSVWIHINGLHKFNVTVICLCVDSSICLFLSCSLRWKDTLDSVSSVAVLSPNLSSHIDLNKNQFLRSSDLVGFCYAEQLTDGASVSLYISTNNTRNVLTYDPNMIHSQATYEQPRTYSGRFFEDTDIIAKRSKHVPFIAVREPLRDVNRNHQPLPLKTRSGDPASAFTEPGLSHRAIVGITLGVLVLVMSHARCLYNGVCRKKKAVVSSALLRNGQVQLMPVQESSGALAAELAGITVDKAVEFSYEELSKATNDFSLGNKIGQGGFGVVYYAHF
ncbi:hypothetical protein M8C21_028416 [Ambrosia artemisiifolia]|uniref:Uncharacterized protein n=1 Tax=Ambrosia artemisiifolia TaxID=4212 RepID=A0AAD5C1A3_AMBAR|nr:hypothetical protein M8C21_028416 [Ambrosia artemisiifolia]